MKVSETNSITPVAEDAAESNRHERYRGDAPLSAAIDAWRLKRSEDVHRKVAAASAAVSREIYRQRRADQGLTVRPYTYHNHAPQQSYEHRDDYEKRIHRDRERARRGVSAETVRPRRDLSNMTENEKAEDRRTQANLRKAKERKRKAEAKGLPIDPSGSDAGPVNSRAYEPNQHR